MDLTSANDLKDQDMIIDFIIYTTNRCFRGYLYALSFFSLCVVLASMSLIKFITLLVKPSILLNVAVQYFFQLSIFLFIPLFIYFIIKKYKYNELLRDNLRVKKISLIACVTSVAIFILILVILFAYLLVF